MDHYAISFRPARAAADHPGVRGCWYPIEDADDVVVLCRRPTQDDTFGLCAEHRARVLAHRNRARRAG